MSEVFFPRDLKSVIVSGVARLDSSVVDCKKLIFYMGLMQLKQFAGPKDIFMHTDTETETQRHTFKNNNLYSYWKYN